MTRDPFSEQEISDTIAHGRKNLRTAERIRNWCKHARITRFGGVGLIEQATGVPIGHMGVECDYAPVGSPRCWDLEEAAISFYVSACEGCSKREPDVGPDIGPLIEVHKKRENERAKNRAEQQEQEARIQAERKREFDALRRSASRETKQVVDLIEVIEDGRGKQSTDALVELALVTPESFSPPIIEFLTQQVFARSKRLKTAALRTLLTLPVHPDEKRALAVEDASGFGVHEESARYIEGTAEALSEQQVKAVLQSFTLLATPRGGLGLNRRLSMSGPLLALVSHHGDIVANALREWLGSGVEHRVETAVRSLWALTSRRPSLVRPFLREVLGKLLRHKILLPSFDDYDGEYGLPTLRNACLSLLLAFPIQVDEILQSLLHGGDEVARSECVRLYGEVLEEEGDGAGLREAQAIAFERLLWMVVESPEDESGREGLHFFSYIRADLLPVAAEHLDAMIGAACTLSGKIEVPDRDGIIETPKTGFEEWERRHRRDSIRRLQGHLVAWAFAVASYQGEEGVRRVLGVYVSLPDGEVGMRANVVEHLANLMGRPEYVNLVLPHLYTAMTSPEALVRGSAAIALGRVPDNLIRDFPRLLFEVYLVLLTDPVVYVHKSAVQALRIDLFPQNLKLELTQALVVLIRVYAREEEDEFVAECLEHFVDGCLTDTQMSGNHGRFVVGTINQLNDMLACRAVERLGRWLIAAPGFVALCARCLRGEWLRHTGDRERIFRFLDNVPRKRLGEARREVVEAALSLANDSPHQTRPLIVLLAKAGCWADATYVCEQILARFSDTLRERSMRLHFEELRQVCAFEEARPTGGITIDQAEASWTALMKQVNEDRADIDARRSLAPFFLR
ncbi:MAG: hypothetical protein OXC69_04385 [Candidatus Tectomicrobia bacterium]|nr:hypothetical protein [Candidatus Tectomicrobia bacterium]